MLFSNTLPLAHTRTHIAHTQCCQAGMASSRRNDGLGVVVDFL